MGHSCSGQLFSEINFLCKLDNGTGLFGQRPQISGSQWAAPPSDRPEEPDGGRPVAWNTPLPLPTELLYSASAFFLLDSTGDWAFEELMASGGGNILFDFMASLKVAKDGAPGPFLQYAFFPLSSYTNYYESRYW
jgi:hypothetical protein